MDRTKWTYENCYSEAKKYTKLQDFQRNCHRAAEKAKINGWIEDYTWLERKHVWSKDEIIELALNYSSISEFRRENGGAYGAAVRDGYRDEIKLLYKNKQDILKLEFIKKVEQKFPNTFLFDNTEYVNSLTEVELICKKCGHKLIIKPVNLLQSVYKCKGCIQIERTIKLKSKFGNDIIVSWLNGGIRDVTIQSIDNVVLYNGAYKDVIKKTTLDKCQYITDYYSYMKPFADKANVEILNPETIDSGITRFYYKNNDNGIVSCSTFNNQKKYGFKFPSRLTKKFVISKITEHLQQQDIIALNNFETYNNQKYKLHLKCNKCGFEWKTSINAFINQMDSGCAKCKNKINLTTEEFIEKAKKVHGDKYEYSKVEYVNRNTKVCIICPEHGEFWQTPNNHLNGAGCPICNRGYDSTYKFNLLEEFMSEYELKAFLMNNDVNILLAIMSNINPKYEPIKKDIVNALQQADMTDPIHALQEKYSDDNSDTVDIDTDIENNETFDLDNDEIDNENVEVYNETISKNPEIADIIPEMRSRELAVINRIEHQLTPEIREYILYKFRNDNLRNYMGNGENLKNI